MRGGNGRRGRRGRRFGASVFGNFRHGDQELQISLPVPVPLSRRRRHFLLSLLRFVFWAFRLPSLPPRASMWNRVIKLGRDSRKLLTEIQFSQSEKNSLSGGKITKL